MLIKVPNVLSSTCMRSSLIMYPSLWLKMSCPDLYDLNSACGTCPKHMGLSKNSHTCADQPKTIRPPGARQRPTAHHWAVPRSWSEGQQKPLLPGCLFEATILKIKNRWNYAGPRRSDAQVISLQQRVRIAVRRLHRAFGHVPKNVMINLLSCQWMGISLRSLHRPTKSCTCRGGVFCSSTVQCWFL